MLLIADEDCNPETLPLGAARIKAIAWLDPAVHVTSQSDAVIAFKRAAIQDAAGRAARHFDCDATPAATFNNLQVRASDAACSAIVTAHAPVGPLSDYFLANEGRTLCADAGSTTMGRLVLANRHSRIFQTEGKNSNHL